MFNSKFGVGILKHPGYNIGGGIGEAALIGAAFGGAKALATGQDPLEAALLGGVTGGAMSGVTGALLGNGASAAGTEIADQASKEALTQGVIQNGTIQGANTGLNIAGAGGMGSQGIAGYTGELAPNFAPNVATNIHEGIAGIPVGTGGYTAGDAIPLGTDVTQGVASTADQAVQAAQVPSSGQSIQDFLNKPGADLRTSSIAPEGSMARKGLDWWANQGELGRPLIAGAAGYGLGALQPKPLPKMKEEEKSKLAGYDRNSFTAYEPPQPNPYYHAQYTDYRTAAQGGVMQSYAGGGIAALAAGNGMGNNQMYPQGMQDHTQYATPSQMPTSSSVIDADYEMKTDPYTGQPNGMAEGGVAGYAPGGQVYYDSAKGQYYTEGGNSNGYFGNQSPMEIIAGGFNPFNGEASRTYLGGGVQGAGGMGSFQASQATPQVYQPQYNPTQAGQAATDPAVQQAVLGGAQNYSLADSLPLLQSTNPGIAAQFASQAPVEKKAQGGIAGYSLGGYAAGGNPRLLKGPGDGMSDNIPAVIGNKQPARLADSEFVVPADVVSHLGNGSTDAGAKHLYKMMDRVRKARTGRTKQSPAIKPEKFLPA